MASIYDDILAAIVTTVTSLDLTPIQSSSVYLRALPRVGETLETLPCILISPAESPESHEALSFEDDTAFQVGYAVEIVAVGIANHDFGMTGKSYFGWRQTVRRAFQNHTLSGVDKVWRIDVKPLAPLNRRLLNSQYAYSGMTLIFNTAEQRGN